MEPEIEQFNNFSSGIHSELRANYEVPKFARLWNFDVSHDRAIQIGGWEEFLDEPGHVVQHGAVGAPPDNTNRFTAGSQLATYQLGMLVTAFSGNGKQAGDQCNMLDYSGPFTTDPVDPGTIPVIYNNATVYKNQAGQIKVNPFGTGPEFQVLSSVTLSPNTFFAEGADNKMYVFSGKCVYSFQIALNSGDATGPYTFYGSDIAVGNLTQYSQLGDVNGSLATYTIGGIPMGYILTEIALLQDRLSTLGYNPGPSDGSYGASTEAAVMAFQTAHQATGTVPGGQPAGAPLVVDGIVGPETLAALNLPLYSPNNFIETSEPIICMPYHVTAVAPVGGTIAFATSEDDANARVYIWDLTRDANGRGEIGLDTYIDMGQGVVQALDVLDGRLIAIMSPYTGGICSACYNKLMFYNIHTNFERFPESWAELILELRLRNAPDPNFAAGSVEEGRYNYILQHTEIYGSRMYFAGRLHTQVNFETDEDEGAMSGVFSIDTSGRLLFHATYPETISDGIINSFGVMTNGFMISVTDQIDGTTGGVYFTCVDTEQESGVITKIINGGQPWRNKQIENIFLAIDQEKGLEDIEIFVREVGDKDNTGAGWVKVYEDKTSPPPPLKRDFKNRVHLNRNTKSMERFEIFREIQVMVKIRGKCVEMVDLTVIYNMLDLNK